ncbi:hypothetical protein CHO01_02110 [Cellulomonas hominis]|uniref:Uncharacterized protein n=1 Tax=Cellulomonas hominis TaxID=156981 RepID=A0A511F777_9CELL|nr:hypothetical protein [Cellulomonas hominis]MBB5474112.1 hypothetical protein [Cellulomonas hominis]GEL45095.1 hypothetical protein CHO01_02110 [Cellulomonas hominis]
MARITGSVMETLPPAPMMSSTIPWNARNAARVATNDGMPTRATSRPMSVPITTPVSSVTASEAYQGQPKSVSVVARMAPQTPDANPADRSIAPSSSTNTRPMPMVTTTAPCWNRFATLSADGNVSGLAMVNPAASTASASTAGSDPMSPPRTRRTYAPTASENVGCSTAPASADGETDGGWSVGAVMTGSRRCSGPRAGRPVARRPWSRW